MFGQKKIVLILFALHFLWILYIFPVQCLFNNQPIYNVDYPFHYYNTYSANRFFAADKHIWGYDPYLFAGYPSNVYSDLDNKWVEILTSFLQVSLLAYAFKMLVFAAFLSAPFFMYLAAINFGLKPNASLISLGLSIFIWNAGRYTYLKIINGMFSYVLACYVSMYFLSVLYKYMNDSTRRHFFNFAAVTAFLPMIHILSVITVIVPAFVLFIGKIRRSLWFNASFLFAAMISLAVNYFWVAPCIRFMHYKILVMAITKPPGISRFFSDLFIGVEANIGFILLVAGMYGIYRTYKDDRYKACIFFFAFLWAFFLAYFSAYNRTMLEMEPYRFRFFMYLTLILPSAITINEFWPGLYGKIKSNIYAFCFFILFCLVLFMPVVDKQIKRANLHTDLPKEYYNLVGYINNNLANDARILVVPYRMRINDKKDDEGFWVMLLPMLTGKDIIHDLVEFHPIQHLLPFRRVLPGFLNRDQITLSRFFELYNIGYLVFWNEGLSQPLINKLITKQKQIGRFNIYRINRKPDYFIKGHGQISISYNKIDVKKASKGSVILKYHWFECLKTRPELKIEKYVTPDDEVGFIKVNNGSVSDFLIYNSY